MLLRYKLLEEKKKVKEDCVASNSHQSGRKARVTAAKWGTVARRRQKAQVAKCCTGIASSAQ